MIKINFKKEKDIGARESKTLSTGLASSGSTVITKLQDALLDQEFLTSVFVLKMVINIILIFCFPLGLKIYEIKEMNKLQVSKQQATAILNQSNQQLVSLKEELNSYEGLQDLSAEFISKIDFLKALPSERLRVLRVLDFIQNQLPNTLWLSNISMDLTQDQQVSISGEGFKEANVNYFASVLHELLDRNTIVFNTRDIRDGSSSSVIKVSFEIKGSMR